MNIRKAEESDLPVLLAIYNFEVENGVATFDLTPRTFAEEQDWFSRHIVGGYPVLVAEWDGIVVGYASLSPYREKEAYRSTVELSIYIDRNFRQKGIATLLMETILSEAENTEWMRTVVSVITSGNEASTRLHEKFGFSLWGRLEKAGKKFGRWLGIDCYSRSV